MRNFLLWTIVIIISIGIYYSINQEQSTTDSYDEEQSTTDSYDEISEEDAASHRNYNEPRVQVSASGLYNRYNSNSIRAKALYDGKLIEITDSPLKVDIAPDGDGIIYLADFFFQGVGVYAKGGKDFKSEAAKLESTYDEITLLCYSDEFSTDNNILTDCIFDLKTNSERDAERIAIRAAEAKAREEDKKAREEEVEGRKAAEKAREEEVEGRKAAEKAREEEVEGRKAAEKAREEKDRKIREKTEQERIKAYAAITKSESKSQNDVETEPYNTTYVDGNSSADSDYFD
ncbi:OB-fold protein [Psychrobacter aquimaris]|uniref:OB-fold protein n=1 Tax=Psychrobacter aquimaris TaxID=292733 RepID=UPI00191B3D24|nr:hypothetical protein [Psychrobacter aquimaris]